MICGNEIFFVKKMSFQKASTPIYLDLDLDLDTLRLYSLLSYVADQNSQAYCLGMLGDFVTKLGLKIDAHNCLLKLYLYRYISIEKLNKQINISIYNERISLSQVINTNKQYIKFINNGKFRTALEQYYANQCAREIKTLLEHNFATQCCKDYEDHEHQISSGVFATQCCKDYEDHEHQISSGDFATQCCKDYEEHEHQISSGVFATQCR